VHEAAVDSLIQSHFNLSELVCGRLSCFSCSTVECADRHQCSWKTGFFGKEFLLPSVIYETQSCGQPYCSSWL